VVSQNLPPSERLKKRREYLDLFNRGKKVNARHLILFTGANGGQQAKLGITASRRVGGAVVRNRVKRLIREYYRRHKNVFATGINYSLVVKESFGRLSREEAEDQLALLLEKGSRRFGQC